MHPTLATAAFGVFHHRISHDLVSVVLLSLASAASYGFGAVFQHRAAVREAPELSLRAGLIVRLARRPMWVVGNALDGVGYLFQFLALRNGSLTLVEPLLVLSLVFALPVAAWLDHRRVSASDVASISAIAIGLAVFLGVGRVERRHRGELWRDGAGGTGRDQATSRPLGRRVGDSLRLCGCRDRAD